MKLLSARDVRTIHQKVIELGGLPGESTDRPLEAVLGRVENAFAYGQIGDAVDLAAWYAYAIARGQPFNDANKRTAWLTLRVCLHVNEIVLDADIEIVEDWVVSTSKGELKLEEFTKRLRDEIIGSR